MNRHYCFTQYETENIINRFGTSYYEKVVRDVEEYAMRWNLTSIQCIPSYSANVVFMCYSEDYGHAVLKIGNPSSRQILTEIHALRQYNERRFCKVFAADIENGILLEERIQPGSTLREESSLDKRLSVFCSLYQDLHVTPEKPEIYPTYTEWVSRITEYMSKRQDFIELYAHMKKVNDICLSVSTIYSQKKLLHGDFHHDNILLGFDGEYIIIDPKGVIGDPVFDVPRFILNEFDDELTDDTYRKIKHIITIFEKKLNIPSHILKQCLYVETVMGICWCVEDGSGPEEYLNHMRIVAFAKKIMGSGT